MLIRRGHNGWFRRFGNGTVLEALAVAGCSGPELCSAYAESTLLRYMCCGSDGCGADVSDNLITAEAELLAWLEVVPKIRTGL